VLRKIIRICKTYRITSIADFIASRYGKSSLLAGVAATVAVVAVTPYIALQLKAVSSSFTVLGGGAPSVPPEEWFFLDKAFYVAVVLAAFSILFGTRHLDATERHEGMVAAIAFESIVKLITFLTVGLFVCYGMFDGVQDIFSRAMDLPQASRLLTMEAVPGGYANWFTLTVLSMAAVLFLPRQFQMTVVENVDETHVRTAAWLFPLYLLAINIFVLPIAVGGLLSFDGANVDPDTFVLTLPLVKEHRALALFVYLGGLSAATSMVIVATVALSIMVSNDLVMPVLLRAPRLRVHQRADLSGLILTVRRLVIIGILLLGYLYYALIGESYALVSIGLISFAAAVQFAPPIIIGLYWRGATLPGALAGLGGGMAIWTYCLLLPSFVRSGWLPQSLLLDGPFAIHWLRPEALLGLTGLDSMSHAVFWSLFVNIGLLVGVSLFARQRDIDRIQGALFVDIFRQAGRAPDFWRGRATAGDLRALLARFLGPERAQRALTEYGERRGRVTRPEEQAPPDLVSHAERLLAGHIGAASARVMMSSVVKGEALTFEGVMEILDATSQAIEYSRRLEQKSRELERATAQLRAANERLTELDRLKDEFVSMVSHELRTPLTSIRAFGEILLHNPDVSSEQRAEFLQIVVRETERLTRLINEVLDLSRMESGWAGWRLETVDLQALVEEAVASTQQLYVERDVRLDVDLGTQPCPVKGDPDRLIQLVINLLSNAVKFCEPGSGRVKLSLASAGTDYRLRVEDNGPGIPRIEQQRIFEKFHQISDRRAGKPRGSGLGLAISRRIVDLHWGRIWVESTPGDGATFIVQLPSAGGEHCSVSVVEPSVGAQATIGEHV
jgi:signal transduction histidine kinase